MKDQSIHLELKNPVYQEGLGWSTIRDFFISSETRKLAFIANYTDTVYIVDLDTKAIIGTYQDNTELDRPQSVIFTHDREHAIIVQTQVARLWSLKTKSIVYSFHHQEETTEEEPVPYNAIVSDDHRYLFVVGLWYLNVWDINGHELIRSFQVPYPGGPPIAVSKDNQYLLLAHEYYDTVYILDFTLEEEEDI